MSYVSAALAGQVGSKEVHGHISLGSFMDYDLG